MNVCLRKKRMCVRECVRMDVWLGDRMREGKRREDTINSNDKDVYRHAHTRTHEINIHESERNRGLRVHHE